MDKKLLAQKDIVAGEIDPKSAYRSKNDGFSENLIENNQPYKKGGILNFFKTNYHYIFVFFFIIVMFSVSLYLHDIYPFGDKSIASYDMLAQIAPFMEHLFDVLNGRSTLFYSPYIAGGADVFGTIAYCLISPFTPIFLLFGEGNCYYGVAIVLPLKLICIAFSAMWFAGKYFKKVPKPVAMLFALLYAYCGYTFVANTYINWLDFLIYLPFVCSGFIKLVKTGKIMGFSVAYALMIYTCFSIASFAMILLYMILFCYGILAANDKKEVIFKTCLALVVSVAISLPVMVPALMAYGVSGRNTGLFENIFNDLAIEPYYRKLSYIVSDTLLLYLTILYFIKNGVKRPIDRFLLVTGVIIAVPIFVDEACNLLNAGSYMSYSLRFGFLNAFYHLFVALKFTEEVFEKGISEQTATLKNNLIFGTIIFILMAVCSAYLIGSEAVISIIQDINNKIHPLSGYDFYPLFAHSLGGLEYVGPLSLIIAILFTLCIITYRKRLVSTKIIVLAVLVVVTCQLSFYNTALVRGNVSDVKYYDQANAILDVLDDASEDSTIRIKDDTDALTNCMPLSLHTNSYSVFSSVINSKNFTAANFFDYQGNGVNVIKSSGGLFLGDMLLGYKYYLHRFDKSNLTDYDRNIQRSYLEELSSTKQSDFVAYENKAAFPSAFTVQSKDLSFEGLNYAEKLNKLHTFLGGSGDICVPYSLKLDDTYDSDIIEGDDGVFTVYVRIPVRDSYWFLSTDFPEQFDIVYCRSKDFNEENSTKLNSGGDILFGYYHYRYATYTATLKDRTGKLTAEDIQKYCTTYGVSVDSVYQEGADDLLYNTVSNNKADLKIKGGNTYIVSAEAATEQTYLFLSYVQLDGHKVTVNGKEAEFIPNDLDLMLIKLEKGHNDIVIKYTSPYTKYAVFGLIGGLFIVLMCLVIIKKPKISKISKKLIYVAAITLFIVVAGFFVVFPTAVFVVKLIKLPFSFLA